MKTRRFIWFVFTIFITATANVNAFTVSKNTVVTVSKQTQVKVANLDLQNNGEINGDTASLLILSNTKERKKLASGPMSLGSLKIAGDVVSEVSILTLTGDLIMQSGVLNIGANRLLIYGDLLGENEKTYVTASTGTIEKWIAYLPSGRLVDILGLEFTPLNDAYNIGLTRSHETTTRMTASNHIKSAERVYQFLSPIDATSIHLQALPHETVNISKSIPFVRDFEDWKKIKNRNDEFIGVSHVSIFAPDELHFPKVIMPGKETHNIFKIIGLDEYPNSRLVIISKGGKILYDLYPYTNDFDGRDLPTGTYYYLFSEEQNSAPIKKSFFEIVR